MPAAAVQFEIISDRQVQHRAETQGTVITRVQRHSIDGKVFEARWWHDWQSGALVRVDSQPVAES
jgi:hypothetical protein